MLRSKSIIDTFLLTSPFLYSLKIDSIQSYSAVYQHRKKDEKNKTVRLNEAPHPCYKFCFNNFRKYAGKQHPECLGDAAVVAESAPYRLLLQHLQLWKQLRLPFSEVGDTIIWNFVLQRNLWLYDLCWWRYLWKINEILLYRKIFCVMYYELKCYWCCTLF